ncbi:hypothetical protein F5X68DRAFT_53343 [Plectosphaerella plurivora]|uniref:Uncharacterized protein n=1 Tax=Plectosphaerella plurivora TaxID=936078 RepID=A0A9P8V077_9PEZI|nr:hypothetical protein F5X68DRAFT_53343 [Plectosphaerella plurivora]
MIRRDPRSLESEGGWRGWVWGKSFLEGRGRRLGEQRRRRDGFNQRHGPGPGSIDGKSATRWTDTGKTTLCVSGRGGKGWMDGVRWEKRVGCRVPLTSVLGRSAGRQSRQRFGWKTGWERGPGEGTERASDSIMELKQGKAKATLLHSPSGSCCWRTGGGREATHRGRVGIRSVDVDTAGEERVSGGRAWSWGWPGLVCECFLSSVGGRLEGMERRRAVRGRGTADCCDRTAPHKGARRRARIGRNPAGAGFTVKTP